MNSLQNKLFKIWQLKNICCFRKCPCWQFMTCEPQKHFTKEFVNNKIMFNLFNFDFIQLIFEIKNVLVSHLVVVTKSTISLFLLHEPIEIKLLL